jgi:hypothetical protein
MEMKMNKSRFHNLIDVTKSKLRGKGNLKADGKEVMIVSSKMNPKLIY